MLCGRVNLHPGSIQPCGSFFFTCCMINERPAAFWCSADRVQQKCAWSQNKRLESEASVDVWTQTSRLFWFLSPGELLGHRYLLHKRTAALKTFTQWKKVQFGSGAAFWEWFHLWVLHAWFLKIQLPRDSTGRKSSKLHPFRSGWSWRGSMASCEAIQLQNEGSTAWITLLSFQTCSRNTLRTAPTLQSALKLSWKRAGTTRPCQGSSLVLFAHGLGPPAELWPRPGEENIQRWGWKQETQTALTRSAETNGTRVNRTDSTFLLGHSGLPASTIH